MGQIPLIHIIPYFTKRHHPLLPVKAAPVKICSASSTFWSSKSCTPSAISAFTWDCGHMSNLEHCRSKMIQDLSPGYTQNGQLNSWFGCKVLALQKTRTFASPESSQQLRSASSIAPCSSPGSIKEWHAGSSHLVEPEGHHQALSPTVRSPRFTRKGCKAQVLSGLLHFRPPPEELHAGHSLLPLPAQVAWPACPKSHQCWHPQRPAHFYTKSITCLHMFILSQANCQWT